MTKEEAARLTVTQIEGIDEDAFLRQNAGMAGQTGGQPETWEESQAEERTWWGRCVNTFGEELKQQLYMQRMGFSPLPSTYGFDMGGRSVLDVGGGPASVLLKAVNLKRGFVVDPCDYPEWVTLRYAAAGLNYIRLPAEEMFDHGILPTKFDLGLMYNCLQHTKSPETIVRKLVEACGEIHIFEWIDIPPHPGHPHQLSADDLNRWTGRVGRVEVFHGINECFGKAWYL